MKRERGRKEEEGGQSLEAPGGLVPPAGEDHSEERQEARRLSSQHATPGEEDKRRERGAGLGQRKTRV